MLTFPPNLFSSQTIVGCHWTRLPMTNAAEIACVHLCMAVFSSEKKYLSAKSFFCVCVERRACSYQRLMEDQRLMVVDCLWARLSATNCVLREKHRCVCIHSAWLGKSCTVLLLHLYVRTPAGIYTMLCSIIPTKTVPFVFELFPKDIVFERLWAWLSATATGCALNVHGKT